MHNLLRINLIVLTIILGVSGCRKDPPIPPDVVEPVDTTDTIIDTCFCKTPCEDISITPEIGPFFTKSGPQYITPRFNPNNENEFIFLRTNTAPVAELVKYNMETEETTVLSNEISIISPPQWSRTGWITFISSPWHVWKIKDDGTELTELTFGDNDQNPHFSYDGNSICYRRGIYYSNAELEANPELYNEHKMMFIDLDGNVIDSVVVENIVPDKHFQKWTTADFRLNELYFIGGTGIYEGLYKLKFATNEIESINIWGSYYQIRDISYLNGYVYLSRFRNETTKINVSTGELTKVKCGCETRYIDFLSASPSGNKILFERVTNTVLDEWSIDEQHEIWIMDADGCNERKILGD